MATMISRQGPHPADRPGLRVVAFRMYPDSSAIIRLHASGRQKSIVNIHLSPVEADRMAEAFQRKD